MDSRHFLFERVFFVLAYTVVMKSGVLQPSLMLPNVCRLKHKVNIQVTKKTKTSIF